MPKIYGLISQLDNKKSYITLKNKGVKIERDFYYISEVGELINVLEKEDTVVTISVNRFDKVVTFLQFHDYLRRIGARFRSISEPSLNFQDGKELKNNTLDYLISVAHDEQELINNLISIYKINIKSNRALNNYVRWFSLCQIQKSFSKG